MFGTRSVRRYVGIKTHDNDKFVWRDESHYAGRGKDRIFIDLIGGYKGNYTRLRTRPILANRLFWYRRSKLPEIRNNISGVLLVGKPRIIFKERVDIRDAIRTFISVSDINMYGNENPKARQFYFNMTVQMIAEAAWRLGSITEVREYVLNFKCRYDVSALVKFNTLI